MKWLRKTIADERRALERARRRFVRKPNARRLHDVRTTGRRFRSLLEDVATFVPAGKLRRSVKRVAAATDAARDAAMILRLLVQSVHREELEMARALLDDLRQRQERATHRACKKLRTVRFTSSSA